MYYVQAFRSLRSNRVVCFEVCCTWYTIAHSTRVYCCVSCVGSRVVVTVYRVFYVSCTLFLFCMVHVLLKHSTFFSKSLCFLCHMMLVFAVYAQACWVISKQDVPDNAVCQYSL